MSQQLEYAWTTRVPFRDVDMNSNVHNSVYLAYCETAINEFIGLNGLRSHFSFEDRTWVYMARRAELVFNRPSTFEDELGFTVDIERLGDTSLTFRIALKGINEDTPRVAATVTWVCVDTAHGTSRQIPTDTRSALSPFVPVDEITKG